VGKNVAQKLIEKHLVAGKMTPGEEIGVHIDQALMQDATGTLVMLELEAMDCARVKTEVAVQYVDHNLLETDFKNADDHLFLQSACERFGIHYSPAGNGVSHPVHMERFGVPGKSLLGSDSHSCAAGSLGMLAIGAGGLEVALALMGQPFHVEMPRILGVHLTGKLPDFVSAKDIILEMLRRFDVDGGLGKIIEYYGPGLEHLTAMDRHVIANMGAELGATATVFPSDHKTLDFLESQSRKEDWTEILADESATYDENAEIDLSTLEPLIALPSSPGNVVTVREMAGKEIYQAMIGSSANPGLRDFAIAALMLKGKHIAPHVSLDVNPTSRQILENLVKFGYIGLFLEAGARLHQAGCNGCIGMGQAPATGKASLRTVPRNFPGRSGTKDDLVYLCSPETAAASAITGVITDPRTLGLPCPKFEEPQQIILNHKMIISPTEKKPRTELALGPNIKKLPQSQPLKDNFTGPVLLYLKDDISTDEILPAGARVLPFRSNIPEIAKFAFSVIDEKFHDRALPYQSAGFVVLAGENYGQGSSREHAALAPRYLGLVAVIAKSYARIHRDNLINFGVVPLLFDDKQDYEAVTQLDELHIPSLKQAVEKETLLEAVLVKKNKTIKLKVDLSPRERKILLASGLIELMKQSQAEKPA